MEGPGQRVLSEEEKLERALHVVGWWLPFRQEATNLGPSDLRQAMAITAYNVSKFFSFLTLTTS